MANKYELAGYLVALHTLLEAQSKAVNAVPSTVLSDEYKKNWDLMKEIIEKDNEDEARKRNDDTKRPQAGADQSSGEPRRGGSTGAGGGEEPHPSLRR